MAVRLDGWIGRRNRYALVAEAHPRSIVLTLEQRRARLQRRRRISQAQVALEGAAWLAGIAVVAVLALGGLYGLR